MRKRFFSILQYVFFLGAGIFLVWWQLKSLTPEQKTAFLEALKEDMTLKELAAKYGVAGTQISSWKSEFIKNASSVFGSNKSVNEEESEKEKLFAKIGQLQLENDFLKKPLL